MPREILLGNGNLVVTQDAALRLRDIYFPGLTVNNAFGCKSSLGVWVEGDFSWLDDGAWIVRVTYKPHTLAAISLATNERLGISLAIEEGVHPRHNLFLRRIKIRNLAQVEREIRPFLHYSLALGGNDIGDTAFYDPESKGMCHFKRDIFFLYGGMFGGEGIHQYTVQKRFGGFEGGRFDAEDGELYWRPVDQGAVDSLVAFKARCEPGGEKVLDTWLVAGRSLQEVRKLDRLVKDRTVSYLLRETEVYWENWLARLPQPCVTVAPELMSLFRLSLLVVRAQIDNGGAIVASTDTDIMATNRDHYAYMWPRDGALVAAVLDQAGFGEVTRAFYELCARVVNEEGYFWHKYHPDGSAGSTWLSRVGAGGEQLPVQEDETALVIWALGRHLALYDDLEFVSSLYDPLVRPAADFLRRYRDKESGLPLPSYDLWEERWGVFTYTAAAVAAGLEAAGRIATRLGDEAGANRWLEAAAAVKRATLERLWVEEAGRFIRGLVGDGRGDLVPDYTLDASLAGVFGFDVLPAEDRRVAATMRIIEAGLWVKTKVGGVARYANDYYFRRSDDLECVPGNPWFVSTLWLAEWYAACAGATGNIDLLKRAEELLFWAYNHRSPVGMLAEQVHPYTGEPLSVSPLTWSHGAFCQAILEYLEGRRAAELVARER